MIGLDPADGRAWLPGGEPLDRFDDRPLPPAVSPTWKAMTSGGSTGRPKLIVTTTPAITEFVVGGAPLIRIGQAKRCSAPAPCTTTDRSFFL